MGAKQGTMAAQGIGSTILGVVFSIIGGIVNTIKTVMVLAMVCLCAATFGLLVLIIVRPDLKDELRTGFLSATVTVTGMEESEVLAYKDETIKKTLPYLPEQMKQNVSGLLSSEKASGDETAADAPSLIAPAPVIEESLAEVAAQVEYDQSLLQAVLQLDKERGNPSYYLPTSDADLIESLVVKYKKEHDLKEVGPVLTGAIYMKFLDSLFKGKTEYVLMAKHMGTKPFLAAAKDNVIPDATKSYAKEVQASL